MRSEDKLESEQMAELIQTARTKREWSRKEMADVFGVDRSTISRWEDGMIPAENYRWFLARFLGSDCPELAEYILGTEEEKGLFGGMDLANKNLSGMSTSLDSM